MTEYDKLSENELQAVIEKAEKVLRDKRLNKRKEVTIKIKELAASIGLGVEFYEMEKKPGNKGEKVPVKYRHPDDPEKTWTGRGVTPKWLQALLDAGHSRSEFEIKKG